MNTLQVVEPPRIIHSSKRPPSLGLANSIHIIVHDIFETGRSVSKPVLTNINLRDSNRSYIQELLLNKLVSHRWLYLHLDRMISRAAIELGIGRNGFTMTISVKITHRTVADPTPLNNNNEAILRMLLLGRIDSEGLKSLKMESEPCSICLDNLSGSDSKHGVPTGMTCSHVFHRRCIFEWLQRKNTCPLCRTVLYDDR